jgi:hypothetical protein
MPELKYAKYIITKSLSEKEAASRGLTIPKRIPGVLYHHRVAWIDDEVVKGAFYFELELIEPGSDSPVAGMGAHTHDYDEIIGFAGTNVKNPSDLGGQVEIWLGDEKHTITKSCLIFVPKGLKHCPLNITRVTTPIVHFTVFSGGGKYLLDNVK